jgi:hypothetical protein
MPEEPTRYDHDLLIEDGTVAKTNRFERMYAADLRGILSALSQGFVLKLRGTDSGHLYAAMMNPGEPMAWGHFAGLEPAAYQLSEAFREQFEGEILPAGPPVPNPQGIEAFVLAGGTVEITRIAGAYRVSMRRTLPPERRRQGAKMLTVAFAAVRRGHGDDFFEAVSAALQEPEQLDEMLLF